jgi:hypothetical protein
MGRLGYIDVVDIKELRLIRIAYTVVTSATEMIARNVSASFVPKAMFKISSPDALSPLMIGKAVAWATKTMVRIQTASHMMIFKTLELWCRVLVARD